MSDITVMFTLPSETFDALKATAHREGAAPGEILRAALSRDLVSRKRRKQADENEVAFAGAVRTLLAKDIVESNGWHDLQRRLEGRGYRLVLQDGRLSLHGRDTDECLVDATGIGISYGALMRRFGGPIPARSKQIKAS